MYREVGQDSVLYTKLNIDDFKSNIKNLVGNSDIKLDLINRGQTNIKRFSLEVIQEQLKELQSQ